jgi:inhibitor of KinA sporulation pathway (predicted exonuclease)
MNTPKHYVIIDLEATCSDDNSLPREQTEIIEIGAVLADATGLEPVREFQTFVRPVRHRTLTPFCTKLTTITQELVDKAPRFPEALAALRTFLQGTDALFCSWGNYDRNQFQRDARFHGVVLPFGERHLNLKEEFSRQLGDSRRYGVEAALRVLGLRFEGTAHRGIDDARNITRMLPWILGRTPMPRRTRN